MTTNQDTTLPRRFESGLLQTDAEMTRRYAELTADYNPIHLDADFASTTSFGTPIIHGTMGLNLIVQAIQDTFGERIGDFELDGRFVRPVHVGQSIRARGTLKDRVTRTYEVVVETEAGDPAFEGICTLST